MRCTWKGQSTNKMHAITSLAKSCRNLLAADYPTVLQYMIKLQNCHQISWTHLTLRKHRCAEVLLHHDTQRCHNIVDLLPAGGNMATKMQHQRIQRKQDLNLHPASPTSHQAWLHVHMYIYIYVYEYLIIPYPSNLWEESWKPRCTLAFDRDDVCHRSVWPRVEVPQRTSSNSGLPCGYHSFGGCPLSGSGVLWVVSRHEVQ